MLKKDKNGFLHCIEQSKFSLNQFEVREGVVGTSLAFIISFKNSPMEFWYRNSEDSYKEYDYAYIQFSPNFTQSEYFPQNDWGTHIEFIYVAFVHWLNNDLTEYIEEQSSIDLWSTLLQKENEYLGVADDYAPFTHDEKKTVVSMIENFRNLIAIEYNPTTNQINEITNKLEYLTLSIDKLNKYDWKGVLIQTLIGIATCLSFDTSQGAQLFAHAKRVFLDSLLLLN
ncbi:hypothetical protein [Paenibacillus paridis]|uniref:hypothetical protein n=1 Tax=Paenibacillus paridis TaxID=2583376 RepID=UPI0011236A27|nr:hypothetical protein [Paenibacillus paridis]